MNVVGLGLSEPLIPRKMITLGISNTPGSTPKITFAKLWRDWGFIGTARGIGQSVAARIIIGAHRSWWELSRYFLIMLWHLIFLGGLEITQLASVVKVASS